MDFFSVVQKRRSIRTYEEKPIEEDKLQKILETSHAAPSAGDLHAYDVVIIRDKQRKDALTEAAWGQIYIARAPVVLVYCTIPDRSGQRFKRRGADLFCVQDATIAASYAQLAATALGLSSVWVGSFDENEVRRVIDAPNYATPIIILPIGYPGETPQSKGLRSPQEFVHEEHMGK